MSKEFKIGIVVAVALGMVYWGSSFLSGSNLFKKNTEFVAVYENVGGLLVSNQVRYQGFKVGRVTEITFNAEMNKWIVTFAIDEKSLVIKEGSRAVVGSADLLGTMIIKLIDILEGERDLVSGDTLRSQVEKGLQAQVDEQIKPLVRRVEALIGSVDSVIVSITKILDKRTLESIQRSFKQIPVITNRVKHMVGQTDSIMTGINQARLGETIGHINSITKNLSKNNKSLTNIFQNIESITDSIAKSNVKQTFNNLSNVLSKVDSIASDIQSGKGSLGLLLKDEKLYNDLAYSAADLDLLLFDLRAHPKRYFHFSLFGKRGKKKEELERDTAEYQRMFPPVVREMVELQLDSALRQEIRKVLQEERGQ
ncbi:MAG: phospholipid/cholesterol/gamma-HCH transport system substrate-binding protein [Saprospiraceae bacterium]